MRKRFQPIEGRNADIIQCVMESPEVSALSDDLQFKIRLCVEEVEENILCYSGSSWVEVSVEREDDILVLQFQDCGVQFDPLANPDPDISAQIDERQIGGLGIFLCKQLADDVTYQFEDKCNKLTMKINIK